jgi:hypothetical protein
MLMEQLDENNEYTPPKGVYKKQRQALHEHTTHAKACWDQRTTTGYSTFQ